MLRLVQIFEQLDRIVGFELRDRSADLFGAQDLQDFRTYGLVEMSQELRIELVADPLDQGHALLAPELLEQIGLVGHMQGLGELCGFLGTAFVDRFPDLPNQLVRKAGSRFRLGLLATSLAHRSVSPTTAALRPPRPQRG